MMAEFDDVAKLCAVSNVPAISSQRVVVHGHTLSPTQPNLIFFDNILQTSSQHTHQLHGCTSCALCVDLASCSLVFAPTHFWHFLQGCVGQFTLCQLLNQFQRWWKHIRWLKFCLHLMKNAAMSLFGRFDQQEPPRQRFQFHQVATQDLTPTTTHQAVWCHQISS